jgi:hypothetical protein
MGCAVESLKIVALGVLAAVSYGLVHDQITVRVCLEYFTVAHPPVFATTNPTLLALGWGVIATWWVGAILGTILSSMAQVGVMPKISTRELVRPVAAIMLVSACGALLCGTFAFVLAERGIIALSQRWDESIAPSRHAHFLAAAWAHNASYLLGFSGGIATVVWTWRERKRRWNREHGR